MIVQRHNTLSYLYHHAVSFNMFIRSMFYMMSAEMFSVSTAANVSVYLYAVSKIVVRDKTKETVHLVVLAISFSTSLYIWDDSSSTDNCNMVCES